MRSVDDGRAFVRVAVPPVALPAANGEVSLQFANRDDGYLYDRYKAGLYWTGDGGKVWRLVQPGGSRTWRFGSSQGWLPLTSLVTSEGHAYALVSEGCNSTDRCTSFDLASSAVTNDTWGATSIPVDPTKNMITMAAFGSEVWLIVVPQGGGSARLIVSDDGGRSFSGLPSTAMAGLACQATALSATVIWGLCITGNLSQAWRSTDGGRRFAPVAAPGSSNSDSILPVSADDAIYQVAGFSVVWLTRDGGKHFSSVFRLQNLDGGFLGVAIASPTTWLVLGGSNGRGSNMMWRTANGGRSWQKVHPPKVRR